MYDDTLHCSMPRHAICYVPVLVSLVGDSPA